ncbi:plasmid pRiA4b ORF-3 family protein [Permianibacter aggregans]|uniref:Uncharacterized protein DUF1186 n=1 Tax=Permianibacter aggregans TaxID=1510150 RepID=A0A4R6US10_9GAMM|nr:plasmid pRiA4b ORF-3 family protein [Permianibacter aggregans]TDQ48413.1 uncharacterized protein DUF1186 [Permianibacter aggregans]
MPHSAIAQLKRLGRKTLEQPNWFDYRSIGLDASDVPALTALALQASYDDETLDEFEGYASIHAWRALAQLREPAAIPALLALADTNQTSDCDWLIGDLPNVLSTFGAEALLPIEHKLCSGQGDIFARAAMAEALTHIATNHPDRRDACVTAIAKSLQAFTDNDPVYNAMLIISLVRLKAVEQASLMAAAFDANRVDWSLLGDWEEVQIELGLLAERQTPKPRFIDWHPTPQDTTELDDKRYQIHIALDNIAPPIWRQLTLSCWTTLEELHAIIQAVMGWEFAHTYQFTDRHGNIFVPEPELVRPAAGRISKDDSLVSLSEVLQQPGDILHYHYDFGDDWRHTITLEAVDDHADDTLFDPVCLDGGRACPPEDCGGPWGYQEKLQILADPEHELHQDMQDWFGEDFDPEAFDLSACQQELDSLGYVSGFPDFAPLPDTTGKPRKAGKKNKRRQQKKARKAQRKRKK